MQRILLIDDDAQLGPPLAAYFARFDFKLDCALKPSLGLAQLKRERYDAAILDVMLPEMDGFALCRAIRKDSDSPLIMLTARGEVMDRVVGLELGADDYVPKPFEPRELVARLQTVLRRRVASPAQAAAPSDQTLRFDGLRFLFAGMTMVPLAISPARYCGVTPSLSLTVFILSVTCFFSQSSINVTVGFSP